MSTTFTVQFSRAQLTALRGLLETPTVQDAAKAGLLAAALRGRDLVVRETGKQRKVDTGRFRTSWKAERTRDGAVLLNSAPYAAVIEGGRRAGARMPPVGPIEAWARRKGIDADPWAIARAISRRGIPGVFILRDAIPKVQKFVDAEVRREVLRVLAPYSGGGGTP